MISKRFSITLALAAAGFCSATPATAASEPLIGEIMMAGFTFCPRGWAEANGQLLPINQHQALFALLGTTYGGDGRTSFALPDLRSRAPVHVGQGPGLPAVKQGQSGGNAPLAPAGAEPGAQRSQSTLAVRFCVALVGIFPSRS